MNAIETFGFTKKFKDVTAVDGVTFSVKEGEFFSLLGENGAGKSTLIKMLCGLTLPTSGKASVFGNDAVTERNKLRDIIGISPQETAVANNLTVKENLLLIAALYGKKTEGKDSAEMLIEELKLGEVINKRAKTLSGGMQRRLSLAMTLVTSPKIIFLDEPTLGLDVRARMDLWETVKRLKGRTTVMLTTHYMEEAEELSDRVAVISKGKIKKIGSVFELKNMTSESTLEKAYLKITEEDYE